MSLDNIDICLQPAVTWYVNACRFHYELSAYVKYAMSSLLSCHETTWATALANNPVGWFSRYFTFGWFSRYFTLGVCTRIVYLIINAMLLCGKSGNILFEHRRWFESLYDTFVDWLWLCYSFGVLTTDCSYWCVFAVVVDAVVVVIAGACVAVAISVAVVVLLVYCLLSLALVFAVIVVVLSLSQYIVVAAVSRSWSRSSTTGPVIRN